MSGALTVGQELPPCAILAGVWTRGITARVALRVTLVFLIVSTTVLQRFGLNLGDYSLNASLSAIYVFLLVALLGGVLQLSSTRLLLYGASLAVATCSLLVNGAFSDADRSSFSSLMLLASMYLPFLFVVKRGTVAKIDTQFVLEAFSNVALFCALCGIVQFYAQFVIGADWLFDYTPYVPEVLRGPTGYNTVIPVGAYFKSNGFFFREPSGFSFLMAFAWIAEWTSLRRTTRLFAFGLALLLTYSGTGILTLLIAMLFPLGKRTVLQVVVLGAAGAFAIWALGDVLNLAYTLGRIDEFGSERSSAYIRYVAPFRLVADTLTREPWTLLIGHGPGTISRELRSYEFHDPTWAKLLFEYGVLGFSTFLALFLNTLRRAHIPIQIRAALFFAWLLMGGHLLSPEQNFLTLGLVGLWAALPREPGASSERAAQPDLPYMLVRTKPAS